MSKSDYSKMQPHDILIELIKTRASMRDFSRLIGEDCADVSRWRKGKTKIKARAVVEICRNFPFIKPVYLNNAIFPKDLNFVFDTQPTSFENDFKVI